MGKDEGIGRGDKKDNIFWDLFVEGWRTSERRNKGRSRDATLSHAELPGLCVLGKLFEEV